MCHLPAAPATLPPAPLDTTSFLLPDGTEFVDRRLPEPSTALTPSSSSYPSSFYVDLHHRVAAPGPDYGASTPNYLGARIPLAHNKLNIPAWRRLLAGSVPLLLDLLQYGFP